MDEGDEHMKKMELAACGLDCNACDLYKAAFDPRSAANLVDWFRSRGWIGEDEGAEAVQRQAPFCMGCWDVTAKQWCGDCNLRGCCEEKAHPHCGECADFPCKDYRAWTVGQVHHQAAMEFLMTRRHP